MREAGARIAALADGDDSLGELIARLVADAKAFVRAELRVYRLEVVGRIAASKGAVALALGGVTLALCAFVALLVGLVIALGPILGPFGAAAAVGLGGMALGGLCVWLAIRRIAAVMRPAPDRAP